jgi:hypothetical protein
MMTLLAAVSAEAYLQSLAKALSHYFKARLLILDATDFSLRVSEQLGTVAIVILGLAVALPCRVLNPVPLNDSCRSRANTGAPQKPRWVTQFQSIFAGKNKR